MWGLLPSETSSGGSDKSALEILFEGIGGIAKSAFDTQLQKKQIDAVSALQALQYQNQPGSGAELQSGYLPGGYQGGGVNVLVVVGLVAAAGLAAYAISK